MSLTISYLTIIPEAYKLLIIIAGYSSGIVAKYALSI